MAHPTETLVRWYLGFNGYLGVENLVVHEPAEGAVPQGAEFDVVAVRDARLTAVEKAGVVNVVIAEVKGGRDTSINDVWRAGGDEALQAARLGYLVRWLGFDDGQEAIDHVVADLRTHAVSDRERFLRRSTRDRRRT